MCYILFKMSHQPIGYMGTHLLLQSQLLGFYREYVIVHSEYGVVRLESSVSVSVVLGVDHLETCVCTYYSKYQFS